MIETFREWKMRGDLNVKYTDSTGEKKQWSINQEFLLTRITGIVAQYQKQRIVLTNRQLYYQLVASDVIPNADEVYKRICKFLTDARYSGLIDWDAIEDRGRVPTKHAEWENVKELVESACSSYRLPRWNDQEYYVELFCEKQAMESVLKPIAYKYHIYFGYNKGYSSASTMYDLAQRIKQQIEKGKKTIVLYLGDHDPSGLDMVRDIQERIEEFLTKSQEETLMIDQKDEDGEDITIDVDEWNVDEYFLVVPIALNMTQITKYNPPPNPAKITDPRAKWYIAKYGKVSWELDALKPEILIDLTDKAIQGYIDLEKYNAWIEKENQQKEALVKFGEEIK